MNIKTDVVIIGAGPCGLFSIFELGLLGLRAHVVDSLEAIGGQCTTLYPEKPIYDVPGIPKITGQQLIDQLIQQASPFDPSYHLGHQVTKLKQLSDNSFLVKTEGGVNLNARAIVVAAGLGAFRSRPLRLAGIENFIGTNLHYSIDKKEQFNNRNIVILGGGDSAIDWVLALTPIVNSVTLVHRRQEFRAAPASVEQMKLLANDPSTNMRYLIGRVADFTHLDGQINTIHVVPYEKSNNPGETVMVDDLLVFYGLTPDLGPIADWGLNLEKRNVKVNSATCETNIPGIFAIGDINSYSGKKKLILAGFHEAALSAYAIQNFLDPTVKQKVQYTTTSSLLQKRLGVSEDND